MESVMAPMPPPAKMSAFAMNEASPSANVLAIPCDMPYTTLMIRMHVRTRGTGIVFISSGSTEGSLRGSFLQAFKTAADTRGIAALKATAAHCGSAYAAKNSAKANVYDTYR